MLNRAACGLLLVAMAATLWIGCKRQREETGSTAKPEQRQADVAAVRRILDTLVSTVNARDMNAALALYTDDAVLLPPDEETISGKEAVRAYYKTSLEASVPKIAIVSDEIGAEDGLAFSRGKIIGQVTPGKEGAPRDLDFRYLMTLRRQPDGTWRIARVMWGR